MQGKSRDAKSKAVDLDSMESRFKPMTAADDVVHMQTKQICIGTVDWSARCVSISESYHSKPVASAASRCEQVSTSTRDSARLR